MPSPLPADVDVISFAEKLFLLLDEGLRTSTYKYAVLLGLIDLCLEHSTENGDAPTSVTTKQLARKVTATYWKQTTPFGGGAVLRQNKQGQGEILRDIERCRASLPEGPLLSYGRARALHPKRIEALEQKVEWKLVEMPLPRLQIVGNEELRFLYRIGWTKEVRQSELRDPGSFDNTIRFIPGAAEHLVRLAPLVRPLVQKHWAAMVSRLNDLPDSKLETHLFDRDRTALTRVAEPLRDLQHGRCLYCDETMTKKPVVDHFIPWSRHPDDGLDNLVGAHESCNANKSDFLASAEHVRVWTERNRDAATLAAIAEDCRWEREPEQTHGTARGIYLRLSSDVRLWKSGREFIPADRQDLEAIFLRVA